jgi:pimeloyl-ACP methyl ester carboxylesterase
VPGDPGAGCNLEDMRLALGERLAARYRIILLDRPGLGWSERRGSDGSSPAYQTAMLSTLLDEGCSRRDRCIGDPRSLILPCEQIR